MKENFIDRIDSFILPAFVIIAIAATLLTAFVLVLGIL